MRFPKNVEQHPVQAFLAEQSFYCWRVEAPRTLLGSVAPYLLLLTVFLITLFPLAPYRVKIGVVYSATGLLMAIFAVSVLRLALFVTLWVATGRSVWLFPNLYSEEIPITHILSPWLEESRPKPGEGPPSLGARLGLGFAVLSTASALYQSVPEGTGVVAGVVVVCSALSRTFIFK